MFDISVLGSAKHVVDMFKVNVSFEMDSDFTLAEASLPNYLMAKIKVSHEWGKEKYMVCQVILTQEMTKKDLVQLVTGIRTWMDGVEPETEAEFQERKMICQQKLKKHQSVKTTLMLESKEERFTDSKNNSQNI